MRRSLLPFVFACLGFTVFVFNRSMPLFEWQISEFSTDLSPTYEVIVSPSPWTARLGDSLDDGLYVFGNVLVYSNQKQCIKEDLNFVVSRSTRDRFLDQIWLNNNENLSWLSLWSWIEVTLSSVYILWFTLWSKQGSALKAIALASIAVIFFGNMLEIIRVMAPFPFSSYLGIVDCHYGTITFDAKLTKIYYETLITLFVGILLEFGVLFVMLRQMRQVVLDRKISLSDK